MYIRSYLFLAVIFGTLSFVQCFPTKVKFTKKTPFKIIDSYYQDWSGEQAGISGIVVQLTLNDLSKNIRPDSLFFKNRKAKIYVKEDGQYTLWTSNFKNLEKRDINMFEDGVDEYGNRPPQKNMSPFKLNEGEVVISYYNKQSLNYYKIVDVRTKIN